MYVSRPYRAWIISFMLERFSVMFFTDTTVLTTRHLSRIDSTFGKNTAATKVQLLAVYNSDHKALIKFIAN